MNKHKIYPFIFSAFLATSIDVNAGGCDTCIRDAANAANGQMTSAINQVTQSVEKNRQATEALNQSVNNANSVLNGVINSSTESLKIALEKSTARIEGSITKSAKLSVNLADHTTKTLVNAVKESQLLEKRELQRSTFESKHAKPASGEVGKMRANELKNGIEQAQKNWIEIAEEFQKWNNYEPINDKDKPEDRKDTPIATEALLSQKDEVWDPIPFITKNQLNKEESDNMQRLLRTLLNPLPALPATETQRGNNPDYELRRRITNAKLGLAHAVLAKSISDKEEVIPISPDDWQVAYVTSKPGEPDEAGEKGKTSITSMLESETLGRLGSEEWYHDVKSKNTAGLLREQIYQQAINNQLMLRLVEQEEQKLAMLALMAVSEFGAATPPSNVAK